jgi:hypothetical protein
MNLIERATHLSRRNVIDFRLTMLADTARRTTAARQARVRCTFCKSGRIASQRLLGHIVAHVAADSLVRGEQEQCFRKRGPRRVSLREDQNGASAPPLLPSGSYVKRAVTGSPQL